MTLNGPCAIRYPRGSAPAIEPHFPVEKGKSHIMRDGSNIVIWSVGAMTEKAIKAADILEEKGISTAVVNMSSLKPMDTELLKEFSSKMQLMVTIEDNVVSGGMGEEISSMLVNDDMKLWHFSPLAVYDMWEAEEATGDPRNSTYLRGDEI